MPQDKHHHATTDQNDDSALTEYTATQDSYLHYDNFSWQVGAVIIVGVFVFWGLIIDKQPDPPVLFVANLLVCLFMSIWLLYAQHNRQLYPFKIHRLHELEKRLGMAQHRRFKDWGPQELRKYIIDQPRGHYLDYAVFVLISLGGPLIDLARGYQFCSLTLNATIVVAVIV